MNIIHVFCDGNKLRMSGNSFSTSGSINNDIVKFKFSSDWDGLAKKAVFWKQNGQAYEVPIGVDNEAIIPAEVLMSEGVLKFGVYGFEDDTPVRIPSTVLELKVAEGAYKEGSESSVELTPSELEQVEIMLAKTQEFINSSVNAPIVGENKNWWVWSTEENDYVDSGTKAEGVDGVSCEHSWNGTTLTITSASGRSSADLKGEKGDKGDKGDAGEKGESGTGVTILGSYASADELKSTHPSGNVGDAYLINGNLYVWSETSREWENVGNIQGPQGEQGIQGEKGDKGDKGDDGTGVTILGQHASEDELRTAHPSGSKGDAYLVNGDLYVWSETTTRWENVGNIKGPQGEQGLQGEKGEAGEKGETGEAGVDGISCTHSWDGTTLTVTSASGTSSADLKGDKGDKGNKGDKGEKGDKGDDGTGVTILGSYASEEELRTAHPNGSEGDAYLINGDLYVWSATSSNWENVGNIKGPKGEQGIQGETGPAGANGSDGVSATHSWNGTILTITSVSGTSSADLKGDKGDTGETGPQGEQGIQGEKGDTGEKGDAGEKGNDGVSATHSWNGTVLTITSASGTSSADLKGEKGEKGEKGDAATVAVDDTVSANGANPVSGAAVYAFAATTALYTATIPTSGWSSSAPYYVQIELSGILSTDTPLVDIVQSGNESTDAPLREAWACITRITTAENSITVYAAEEIPSVEIPIQMRVVR